MCSETASTDEAERAFRSVFAEYEEDRARAVQTIKRCIQSLRDHPDMTDRERWAMVQTINLFWRYLPEPSSGFELDIETQAEFDLEHLEAAEDDRQPRSRAEIEAEVKARLEREEAEEHAEILKELGTTDEELVKLFDGHVWGFYPETT